MATVPSIIWENRCLGDDSYCRSYSFLINEFNKFFCSVSLRDAAFSKILLCLNEEFVLFSSGFKD